MKIRKRIEVLELRRAKVLIAAKCICYPHGASFHTTEECEQARASPCPIHGFPRFRFALITLTIDQALAPADRHLCHCPPMLARQAEEEGRVLTATEQRIAAKQYDDYWNAKYCNDEPYSSVVAAPAIAPELMTAQDRKLDSKPRVRRHHKRTKRTAAQKHTSPQLNRALPITPR